MIKSESSTSKFFNRLLFSDVSEEPMSQHGVIGYQWERLNALWNNTLKTHSAAIGIERILKLFLVAVQFLLLGLYVRALFNKFGPLWRVIGIELYVLFKVASAILILWFQPFNYGTFYSWVFALWVSYMISESVLYTAALIFCSDVFDKPASYKRNLILLLFDYAEITVDFASLYLIFGSLRFTSSSSSAITSLDAAYFSFVTSVTVGYGDIAVSTDYGKILTILQIMVFLLYGVLFLNFYTSRFETVNKSIHSDKSQ